MKTIKQSQQKSYVLRLWRSDPDQTWRILLKPITNPEEPAHFSDFAQLVHYLQMEEGGESEYEATQ